MSEAALIAELEASALTILAPPTLVTNEQRHAAESIFLNFRKTSSPYRFCREILEKSSNDYVKFEAADLIKSALIREWSFLLEEDKVELRRYLMHYVMTRELPLFVRERLLLVIAIIAKRFSVNDEGKEMASLLQEVGNSIMNDEPYKKLVSCHLIMNLIQEYSISMKSTDVGLTWEVHCKARALFEKELPRIFRFCVNLLAEVAKNDRPYSDVLLQVTGSLLDILEEILTLEPIARTHIINRKHSILRAVEQAPSLTLKQQWREIIFNPQFLPLMFKIYWKTRDQDHLAQPALTCLVQLATLKGTIFENYNDRLKYLLDYLTSFFNMFLNMTIKSKEALGIAQIVRKLVLFHILELNEAEKLDKHIQTSLLDEFTRLTCLFCEQAQIEEAQDDDERLFCDAFETMLQSWVSMAGMFQESSENYLTSAMKMFNLYVQCHLAQPDGTRLVCEVLEEIEDNEDNDRTLYQEQLQVIGMFGQAIPGHSLPLLCNLIESRLDKLIQHFGVLQSRVMNLTEYSLLEQLFEDLHWLILISGHVLCLETNGETPIIPSQIMKYSIAQSQNNLASLVASQQLLHNLDNKAQDNFSETDFVIRLVYNILKLCSLEEQIVAAKLGHFLSPEVGSSLMWFLKTWSLVYLVPEERNYSELSPVLIGCLGRDTECSGILIRHILTKIQSNVFYFQSEPVLLKDTVDLFFELANCRQKAIHIIKTQSMQNLISFHQNLTAGSLPPEILRGLARGFMVVGASLSSDPEELQQYYQMIFCHLDNQFLGLLSKANFMQVYLEENTLKTLIDLLENFIGLARGVKLVTSDVLFDFLVTKLDKMSALLKLYSGHQVIVLLILELFGHVAAYQLCYLSPKKSDCFYQSALNFIQTYASLNSNRFTNETYAEESDFQDLLLLFDLLTYILSKDCIDLCDENLSKNETQVTAASDVSLFGLNFLMPLMTMDLLKYPNLCHHTYKLIDLMADICPEKIFSLQDPLLNNLIKSIELGLVTFGSDIVQFSLNFLEAMSNYIFKNHLQNFAFSNRIKSFLRVILDLTLTHQIDLDLIGPAGICLFALIRSFPEEYKDLVATLTNLQEDPLTKERLLAAFTALAEIDVTSGNSDYMKKQRFKVGFERFIIKAHGFLLVK